MLKLDDWQKQVVETKGNLCLRSGRQVGKSTVISIKAGEYAVNNPAKTILVIASVERQARLLFDKILNYIYENHKKNIKRGKDRPTKHKIVLTNGSVIHCLPTGLDGYGIRGYTVNLLIADEAAFIPEEVWTAVTPMLAVTRGNIILLSTPCGKEGYFYRAFEDDTFTTFHVSAEDCPRKNEDFLKQEKKRMTKLQYAQEYLGEFIDELKQFFPNDLIKKCMTLQRTGTTYGDYYLGVDVAGFGEDESTYEVLKEKDRKLTHVESKITRKTYIQEVTNNIIDLENLYNFNRIYIDDGGMGVGVFEQLLFEEKTKRKVIAINNARRSIDRGEWKSGKMREGKRAPLMKEDLYNNLLRLMERGEINLLDDPEIMLSLRSVQAEYTDDKYGRRQLRIHGSYTHIVEGLIRAAWCVKDKGLNIWIM